MSGHRVAQLHGCGARRRALSAKQSHRPSTTTCARGVKKPQSTTVFTCSTSVQPRCNAAAATMPLQPRVLVARDAARDAPNSRCSSSCPLSAPHSPASPPAGWRWRRGGMPPVKLERSSHSMVTCIATCNIAACTSRPCTPADLTLTRPHPSRRPNQVSLPRSSCAGIMSRSVSHARAAAAVRTCGRASAVPPSPVHSAAGAAAAARAAASRIRPTRWPSYSSGSGRQTADAPLHLVPSPRRRRSRTSRRAPSGRLRRWQRRARRRR